MDNNESGQKDTPNLLHVLSASDQTAATDNTDEKAKKKDIQTTPVTKDGINQIFEKYIDSTKLLPPIKMILQNPFVLTDETKIVFPIKNSVEISMMKKIAPDLLETLRSSLSNSSIEFIYDLEAKSAESKPYTNTEIFNAMAKKNPDLLKLKEVLGLDTDF